MIRSNSILFHNDGRGDNGDGVLYRVDWLYNCLVRYVGSYNIDENIVRLVGRSRVMLEDIVNAHSNSDNNGSDKPTQLLSQVTQAHSVENI